MCILALKRANILEQDNFFKNVDTTAFNFKNTGICISKCRVNLFHLCSYWELSDQRIWDLGPKPPKNKNVYYDMTQFLLVSVNILVVYEDSKYVLN